MASTSTRLRRIDAKLRDLKLLRDHFPSFNVETPIVEVKLREGNDKVMKCLQACISDMGISIVWPKDYPDEVLEVTIADARVADDKAREIANQVDVFASAFIGAESGCAMEIISHCMEMIEDHFATAPKIAAPSCPCIHVIKYNHLLFGNEHKKEKDMVTAAKSLNVAGGIYYGTPGLVLLVSDENESDVSSYMSECKSIGKKGDLVYSTTLVPSCTKYNAITTGKGLCELSLEDLQAAIGGVQVFRSEVLGIK